MSRRSTPLPWRLPAGLLGAILAASFLLAQGNPSTRQEPKNEPSATPLPPAPPSPIEYFRELLAANTSQRDRLLAEKPPAQREHLRDKLIEYDHLPPGERELRLRMLQLQWYLLPLMQTPPTNRAEQLAAVPEDYRPVVAERLQQWDLLPRPLQKEVLERETARNYFVRLDAGTPTEKDNALKTFPSERRQQLEQRLSHWLALPAQQRQEMFVQFNRFFEMTPSERQRILQLLPEPGRDQMIKTVASFEALDPAQRQQCLDSFRKFAGLTPSQR
ncbi:MAG: DUF3106 domain-containing protein, partial [Candidatus Omnitrophica bacterium]|nr:DUF3106 domain-containing protein [Candidatus Omnitrophota bacterium]